jgi:hypothetical protein
MNARKDCSSLPQRMLFGMVAGELPPTRKLPQSGCYVRVGDHPTGTQRTDDTELGERIALFSTVEHWGISVARDGQEVNRSNQNRYYSISAPRAIRSNRSALNAPCAESTSPLARIAGIRSRPKISSDVEPRCSRCICHVCFRE